MTPFILALDQGTTSSRAILFDRAGQIHGMAQKELRQIFPQPGWVEHDAEEIWTDQLAVARDVMRSHGVTATDIAAIGITNQRETTVIWDRKTGVPIANAIVWQDRRTAGLCEALQTQGHAEMISEKTGLVLDAYFSASKIKWLLDHTPGARAKAERGELAFGTIDSWLAFKLCGAHVTDASNASRTMLFNITEMRWDQELLDLFELPRSILPDIIASSGMFGKTFAPLLGAAIPLAGIAGDQQAATFGQACHRPGMAKNTYGTGCFMLMNTGKTPVVSENRLLTTVGWTLEKSDYMLEGSVFTAGATIQWLRDGMGMINQASEVEALASGVTDTGGVMFVPAFAGLGAPYWDPYARGTIIGLSRGTTKAHIARAALEAIAYQSADILDAMQKDAGIPLLELRVDGGSSRNDFLMQFQADILGVAVVRPVVTETTALGAAYLAGLALRFWQSTEEIASQWRADTTFLPRMDLDERLQRQHQWCRAVERSRQWVEP